MRLIVLFHFLGIGSRASVQEQQQQQQQQNDEQPTLRLRPRIVSLNIMVAGLSGLACASLLESWQKKGNNKNNKNMNKTASATKTPTSSSIPGKMTKYVDPSRQYEHYDEKENTILRVRIIDTPGFGMRVVHRDAVRPIARFIATCRAKQYQAEMSSSSRYALDDNVAACDALVHVCLYFLPPGRILEMDLHFLKLVQKEVVVVPIIAKADTLTDDEVASYREDVVQVLKEAKIIPYNFDYPSEQLEKTQKVLTHGRSSSNQAFSRGRRPGEPLAIVSRDGLYTWGSVKAFDPKHSDLGLVRDLLLSGHTETFIEMAKTKYGVFRARKIQRRKVNDVLRFVLLILLGARAFGIRLPFPKLGDDGDFSLASAGSAIYKASKRACVGLLAWLKQHARGAAEKVSDEDNQGSSVDILKAANEQDDTAMKLPGKQQSTPSSNPFLGVFGHGL